MMFVYQYLTLGGVEAVILSRMKQLRSLGIASQALFFYDLGGRSIFKALEDDIAVSADPQEQSKYISEFKPTHLITFDTPQIVPIADQVTRDCRLIYEVHTIYNDYFLPLKDKDMVKSVDAFFVPSEYQRRIVRDILDDHARIYVVPNGLQEDFLKPIKPPSTVAHRPIVIWIGRLDSTKNWRGFLAAGQRIASERMGVALWLVGGLNSPHEEQYQLWSLAKKKRLTKNLRWFPSVEHKDMPAVYQYVAASGGCLLSTSLRESFGVAVLEGMACGCPVVVPEASALVDLVNHDETGLLYRSGNYKAASKEILRLLDDQAFHDKVAQEGILYARKYSPESVTAQFLETLSSLDPTKTNEDEPRSALNGETQ